MSMFGGKKDQQLEPAPMPSLPQRRTLKISEQAAQAAQHVLDLEDENDMLRQQYAMALNRVALVEQHMIDLQRKLEAMTDERDDYKHHYTYIYSSLQHAGGILVQCMNVPARAKDNDGSNNDRIKEAVGRLEADLRGATDPSADQAGAGAQAPGAAKAAS